MINLQHLLDVAVAYRKAEGIEDKTISNRVFADAKKLTALRCGADITITRFNDALMWFSANWPDGAEWPSAVPRPVTEFAA
ncbi:hypothetical protein N8E89_00715 [Phyllobacterium sp. A18/5-2]|uniref:hypothetical protein n=1 Tax=Phyllobacterium sp. A18/5-2 TaxID=2978392 RepID=UPI0021CA8915|nr:hypothetical protein [Phyllobacterium sp. A18/5-2]UXN64444.1 hypothetical protein N8E89_00715 [Phyllobacterium sp. A18/5-2]